MIALLLYMNIHVKTNLQANESRARTLCVNKSVTVAVYLGTPRNENVNKDENKTLGKCPAHTGNVS